MKKVWNDANLVELDITATAGGKIWKDEVDGEKWWDEKQGKWHTDHGVNPALSVGGDDEEANR